MRRAVAFLLATSCARQEPAPVTAAPTAAIASVAPTASASASASASEIAVVPPPSRKLKLVKGKSDCSVVDEVTGEVVGRATTKNTAAGGSEVECQDFLAEGRVIRFANSRGVYAKDARPGANDAKALPCGEGVFANDVKSCVRLDVPPQMLSGSESKAAAAPFDIEICAVDGGTCQTLITVPRGLNRLGPPGEPGPRRWWDAAYCADDRVLVRVRDALSLFEAPSGRLVSQATAPKATEIIRCAGGVAELRTTSNATLVFSVEGDKLEP